MAARSIVAAEFSPRDIVRFWARVHKTDGCWEWIGTRQKGHGRLNIGRWPRMRSYYAHRVSYALVHGRLPDDACVLHLCDNRACVRVDHLELGDRAENTRQRYERIGPRRATALLLAERSQIFQMPQRFWSKVNKSESCWLWTGARHDYGYGLFKLNGIMKLAHRVAYTLTNGPILDGLFVLHSCDVPACCNPDHLRLGTHKDNTRDKVERGRLRNNPRRGEDHPHTTLTTADVIRIRRLFDNKLASVRQLAESYNRTYCQIDQIVRRRRWKHLP